MARVQESKYGHVRTYGWGLERLLARTYGQGSCTWLGQNGETTSSSCSWGGNGMCRVHGEATECVVFMGRQGNASCSSGGNETRGSQPAGLERNAWSCSSGGLGWNRRWKRGLAYHTTEQTDLLCSEWGPVDREGSGVPQNGGNKPPTVETGVLLTGRSVAYRKTNETDLLRLKQGSCSSGGVWRTAKWDSTGYC